MVSCVPSSCCQAVDSVVFVVCFLFSAVQVAWVRRRLMENGKVARATHNVAAWRVRDEARGVQLHDNDDDGKSQLD